VVAHKFGPDGVYHDKAKFARIYNQDFGDRYLNEAKEYGEDVIACVKDVCAYIYETHGRFPAHVDAIYVPGIWLQVHHPDIEYYERFFRNGLTDVHRRHDQRWHPQTMHS
jgi:hypothetical protein